MSTKLSQLALGAVILLASAHAGTASAHSQSSGAYSRQLAALVNAHEAYSAPNRASKRLALIQAQRPLTGEQTVLPVLAETTGRSEQGWLQVCLPGRPNGHAGWIQRRDTLTETTPWRIVVDTVTRQVTVYKNALAGGSLTASGARGAVVMGTIDVSRPSVTPLTRTI